VVTAATVGWSGYAVLYHTLALRCVLDMLRIIVLGGFLLAVVAFYVSFRVKGNWYFLFGSSPDDGMLEPVRAPRRNLV
jgi:hypothetical protein